MTDDQFAAFLSSHVGPGEDKVLKPRRNREGGQPEFTGSMIRNQIGRMENDEGWELLERAPRESKFPKPESLTQTTRKEPM